MSGGRPFLAPRQGLVGVGVCVEKGKKNLPQKFLFLWRSGPPSPFSGGVCFFALGRGLSGSFFSLFLFSFLLPWRLRFSPVNPLAAAARAPPPPECALGKRRAQPGAPQRRPLTVPRRPLTSPLRGDRGLSAIPHGPCKVTLPRPDPVQTWGGSSRAFFTDRLAGPRAPRVPWPARLRALPGRAGWGGRRACRQCGPDGLLRADAVHF